MTKQTPEAKDHAYTVDQLKRLPDLNPDVLSVVLDEGKTYTEKEARAFHDRFLKREVK